MSSGKGGQSSKPKLGGLNEINVPTAETDQPHNYFSGARKLNVAWVMNPVISHIRNTPGGGKGK